jgi:hypothetical protein
MQQVYLMLEAQLFAATTREMTQGSPLGDYAADIFAQLIATHMEERNDATR